MPQAVWVTTALGAERAVRRRSRGRTRSARSSPASVRSPSHAQPAAVGLGHAVERNAISLALEDLVVDRLVDARHVVVAERLHPAGALAARAATSASAVSSMLVPAGSSATTSVASQAVTWMTRSCPAFAAAPARSVRTASVALSGPSR